MEARNKEAQPRHTVSKLKDNSKEQFSKKKTQLLVRINYLLF